MRWITKLHDWANRHEILIILVSIVILLRLPSLFTPHYYGDEEIYFVMGRAWSEGVPMYEQVFDHKPPLIYVLAGIAQNVFWFRMMLLINMVLHTILFYKLAEKVWSEVNKKWALLSSILFVILTTIPTFEGDIANAELFMMLPLTASLLMIWQVKNASWKRYLASGLVAGIGWLYKVPVVADFAAFALFFFPFQEKTFVKSIRSLFSLKLWMYVAGFALPLLFTFAYYYLKGHGPAYLDTVLTINLGYVSSWSTSTFAFNPLKSGLVGRALIVAGITLVLYVFRNRLSKPFIFMSLWLAFSFFGAMLSARPYPHYLQQPFVPLSLFIPFLFVAENVVMWIIIAAFMLWAFFAHRSIKFWAYDTTALYTKFVQKLQGRMTQQEYVASFDGGRRNYLIAEFLNARLQPQDKLFVWGSDVTI